MDIDEITEEIAKDYRNVNWQDFDLDRFIRSIISRAIAKGLVEIKK